MKPVSFGYPAPGGFQEWVIKALRQVETASRATLTNDTASSAGAMNSLPPATANQFAYFTSQTTTAYANLSALALALLTLQRTAVGDANYQVLVTDGIVATSAALSVARTWTMAKASTVAAGQPVNLVDEVGGITAANTLTVAVTAGDKLNGVLNDTLVLNQANAWIWLESDGSGNWSYSLITTPLLAQLAVTTAKLAANAVTNAKLAQMVQATVKGRAAASGTGDPVDLSQAQLTALVNAVTTSLSGAVPAAPNDTTKFFRGDATFAVPPSVTASAAGYVPTFPNNTTTFFRGDGTYAADNGMVLLNTLTANNSSGTLSDTTSLTSTYSSYQISIQNLIPATTANTLILQVHSAGSFQSGANSYQWGNSLADNAGTGQSNNGTDTSLRIGQATRISSTTANGGISGTITVINPSSTTVDKHWFWQVMMAGSTNGQNNAIGSGEWYGNQGAVDGFQLTASVGGNWVSGVVKIYGVP